MIFSGLMSLCVSPFTCACASACTSVRVIALQNGSGNLRARVPRAFSKLLRMRGSAIVDVQSVSETQTPRSLGTPRTPCRSSRAPSSRTADA